MISFGKFGQVVLSHTPAILTAIGVGGVVGTAISSVKAHKEAEKLVTTYKEVKSEELDIDPDEVDLAWEEYLKLVWPVYLPPVIIGTVSVLSIISSHSIHVRRNAALMSAYVVSEKALAEYQEKTKEFVGETDYEKIRNEIAQKEIDSNPPSNNQVIIAGGDTLCYETYTGRYFKSDVEAIRKAQNDINAEINEGLYSSMNDFFSLIGLPVVKIGDSVGWNVDKKLEIIFDAVLSETGTPCLAINYTNPPSYQFSNIH